MADRKRLTSPPIQASHAASNTHRKTHEHTHIFPLRYEHAVKEHKCNQWSRRQRANGGGFYFFLNITSLFLCSPCVFMSCHLVKRLYGLPRPHGYACGEVDCGSFRIHPGPALSASDKRASPESVSLQTGKLINLVSSPIPFFFLFPFSLHVMAYREANQRTSTNTMAGDQKCKDTVVAQDEKKDLYTLKIVYLAKFNKKYMLKVAHPLHKTENINLFYFY